MKIFDKNTLKVGYVFVFFLIYTRNNQDLQFLKKKIINQDGFIENHW